MQVAEELFQKLHPGKRFTYTTRRRGELCDSEMKLSWSDNEGWEVHPDAIPCVVRRTIEFY